MQTQTYNEKKKIERNSSIELLKIFALFLIVISHSMPVYGDKSGIGYIDVAIATTNGTNFLLSFLQSLGQIGNVIFIICSAYFLLDSNRTKKEKIINIIVDSFIISMIFLGISLVLGVNIPIKEMLKQFLPITYQNNWFIGCYLLLYAVHPLLNIIINDLQKRQLFRFNLTLLFLYCIISFVLKNKFYYNELIGFIMLYFFVAYVKLYMPKFQKNAKANIIMIVLALLAHVLILAITNILGLKFDIFANKMTYWNGINNITFICIGIGLLNICLNKKINNRFINYCSSLSLLFYLIHDNAIFRTYIKPDFYRNVFEYGHILLWILIEIVVLFIGAMLLSTLYKETIQKLTSKFSKKIGELFKKYYVKIEERLLEK